MSRTADLLRSLELSPEVISVRTGLSEFRIRELISGATPTLSELRVLSKDLRVSFGSFVGRSSTPRRDDLRLLFRRVGSLKGELDPTFSFVLQFVEAALELLPKRDEVPSWMRGLDFEDECYEEAQRLAEVVRDRLFSENEFGPIPELALHLGGNAGVIVSRLNQSRFEGASLIVEGYPFMFVSPRFAGRMLFTQAHELGHLVTHHLHGEPPLFEKASEIGGWRQRKREAFVDAFASNLLLPAKGVGIMLQRIREHYLIQSESIGDIEILLLARFFGVSFDVAARRCEALELLPVGGAISLSEKIKSTYGSAEKRAAGAQLPPRVQVPLPPISENLFREIHAAISEGRRSVGWAADRFGVSVNDLFDSNKKHASEHHS